MRNSASEKLKINSDGSEWFHSVANPWSRGQLNREREIVFVVLSFHVPGTRTHFSTSEVSTIWR